MKAAASGSRTRTDLLTPLNTVLRDQVAQAVLAEYKRRNVTQMEAAELMQTTQPRISAFVNRRFDLFSLDALVAMADRMGLTIELSVSEAVCGGRTSPKERQKVR